MSAASTSAILRHVPSEILEQILVNLPVKSLLRFSTISKSWHSMISESGFVQEHMSRAAINGRERMVTMSFLNHFTGATSVCRIPLTSSLVIDDSTDLICPIEGTLRRLRAFCDGLWLVEAARFVEANVEAENCRRQLWKKFLFGETESSLFLWNHSMRTHRKLPDSLLSITRAVFMYGLAYDSAADDYKVLKIAREESSPIKTELYSLKSDSWKTISPPPGIKQERCEFVNGAFHWIRTFSNTIVSFNLSTEKSGEIVFPAIALECKYKEHYDYENKCVEVVVMRGKLCVSVNNSSKRRPDRFCFVLRVMEEYGVEKSWTKMLNIEYGDSPFYYPYSRLRPVCFYDNGDILLNASDLGVGGLCMYNNKGSLLKRIVARDGREISEAFICVESLVSPLPGINANKEGLFTNKLMQRRKVLAGSR